MGKLRINRQELTAKDPTSSRRRLIRSFPLKTTEKEEGECLPLTFPFLALLSLDSQDLTAVVGTASLASSVGHNGLTALGANRNAGSRQLPVGATALIAAGGRHITLRNSHGDTSLVELLSNSLNNRLLVQKLL